MPHSTGLPQLAPFASVSPTSYREAEEKGR